MASRRRIERLRTEADTLMTRYDQADEALRKARSSEGEHWEDREIVLELETPGGESIEVTLDLDSSVNENAEERYSRAKDMEREIERRESVVKELSPLPSDPVAYLIMYHLDRVEGNYPKSMAGYLEDGRKHVEKLCKEMEKSGLLERVESGTVKQRRVKAKKAEEVRQHHTYYRLSREGDHLLRFLESREGRFNVLKHLPASYRVLCRLSNEGVSSPRGTAKETEMEFEYSRHIYRTLERLGLVTKERGKSGDQPRKSSEVGGKNRTFYVAAADSEELINELKEKNHEIN
ncbi:MAG: DUF2250 domain-containing protein [Halobacteria archaeon]